MQAYYEIEAEIPLNHQLKLQLPENIPSGRVKVAVIYADAPAKTLYLSK